MDRVLAGLKWGICLVYLDDVLIMAPDFEGMLERLRKVLERLREAAMTLNPSKCTFGFNEVRILGYTVDPQGIRPNDDKVKCIQEFPTPRRLRAVRAFVGLCSYYRKFVPNFSAIVKPLVKLTKKGEPFQWGTEQEKAFRELKERLVTAPILRHFNPELPVELHTDASDYGIGATIMQVENGECLPVAYASRRLSDAETRYNTSEKECVAIVWATQHFRQLLWGRKFEIVVDHHALCWLNKNKDVSGSLARWALKLMEHQYSIRHRQGKLHVVPDSLSRNPCADCTEEDEKRTNEIPMLAINVQDLEKLQDEDEECKRIKEAVKNPDGATSRDRRLGRSFVLENGILYRKNVAHLGQSKLLLVQKSCNTLNSPQCILSS